MSETVVAVPLEGDPDTFAIAQNLLRLASSPWSPPTQESVDMAIAIYQAAMKLHSAPPLYKPDNPRDVESLQQRLAAVTEELRITKQELRDARQETERAILAMNERLRHLLDSPIGQSYNSAAEGIGEGDQSVQDPSTNDTASGGTPSMEEDTATAVGTHEATRGITITSETDKRESPTGDTTSESQELDRVADVPPSRVPENRWTPPSVGRNTQVSVEHTPELVERKVKAFLNKVTAENVDSVSAQIAGWVNQAEHEKNGQTLSMVIRLIFEKATDEPHWSELYAKLCKKLMESISPSVTDENSRKMDGEPIVGSQLFRKFLLNRCQENFVRGWIPGEGLPGGNGGGAVPKMGSEDYYNIVKAKRQGLGLVRFIGELFKLQMVTERIIHECIKKLLPDLDDPNEAELESLLKLLTTVGEMLENPKSKSFVDRYFGIIRMVADNENIGSRMRYMIMDVIELRQRHWRPRNAETEAPTSTKSHDQFFRPNVVSVPGRRWSSQQGHNRGGSPLG